MNNSDRITKANLCWLEDPTIFQINRLPAHSDHAFYEDENSWKQSNQTLKQSLNGQWRLKWSAKPRLRPERFMEEGYDISGFDIITVPGHLELAGYGQIQYINTAYPWDGHAFLRPPHIDWENDPVASYVKEFDLNDSLIGKRICISFQGAEEAIYIWLNGHFIGYGEDSFTPSDYDITDFVHPQGNRLCVELYKRSSAAWIEDQDFFRFSGLFREVFLYAKPEGHVEDLKVTADYDVTDGKGIFTLQLKLSGREAKRIKWKLFDDKSVLVSEGTVAANAVCKTETVELAHVIPWDVKKPYLYQLLIYVRDDKDKILEIVPYAVGFRHFEIQDKIMKLNGRRLLVNGVDRHEWNPKTGRVLTERDMRQDISIMKKNGINAVRTSHYPNQSLWYQLCDEAGICVMDEANLESHGTCMKMGITEVSWNIPHNNEAWLGCCLDRAISMYERDKNHASILWWSAGNESHVGTVIQKMCEYFHESDPHRLVHYEGVFYDRNFDFITDVESQMYPHPDKVREYLENDPEKPMCLCEYMHDMGNSMGGLESYMMLREEFPLFQGGFLWDFIDQALYAKNADGTFTDRLCYGGDFGERPTDYAFCANGLLFANRTPKPAMDEVRYWYMDTEQRLAHDLSNAQKREACRLDVLAELEKLPDYPVTLSTVGDSKYQVPVGIAGSSIVEQAPFEKGITDSMRNIGPFLKVIHTDCNLGLYGEGFHYVFSLDKGGPVSLVIQGKEQLYRAPRPTFWRAPTENDMGCSYPMNNADWVGADLFSAAVECMIEEFGDDFSEELVPLEFTKRAAARKNIRETEVRYIYATATTPKTFVTITYRINAYGKIRVSMDYKGNEALPDLPAFGLQFVTAEKIENYTWDGLSGETYPDRYKGAVFGSYESTVEITPYLVPQECGNHKDTYRMKTGKITFLMSEKPFNFSVLPYSQHQIAAAYHQDELPLSCRSIIRILGALRGVGGIDSWGSDVEQAYHVNGKDDIRFSFYMIPDIPS
ncbi:MAG: beta-galactosidase [Enterocloster citroniae]|nr:beta-galactosidase [Enterocloster citroniae]